MLEQKTASLHPQRFVVAGKKLVFFSPLERIERKGFLWGNVIQLSNKNECASFQEH